MGIVYSILTIIKFVKAAKREKLKHITEANALVESERIKESILVVFQDSDFFFTLKKELSSLIVINPYRFSFHRSIFE